MTSDSENQRYVHYCNIEFSHPNYERAGNRAMTSASENWHYVHCSNMERDNPEKSPLNLQPKTKLHARPVATMMKKTNKYIIILKA